MIELLGAATPTKTPDAPAAGAGLRASEGETGAARPKAGRDADRPVDDPFAALVAQQEAGALVALRQDPAAAAADGKVAREGAISALPGAVVSLSDQDRPPASTAATSERRVAQTPATPEAAAAPEAHAGAKAMQDVGSMPLAPRHDESRASPASRTGPSQETAGDATAEPAAAERVDQDPAPISKDAAHSRAAPAATDAAGSIKAAFEPSPSKPSPIAAGAPRPEAAVEQTSVAPAASVPAADAPAAPVPPTDQAKPGRAAAPDMALARVDAAAPEALQAMTDAPDAKLETSVARLDPGTRAPAAEAPPAVAKMEAVLRRLDHGEIEIRLDPPELGRVKVSLSPSEAGLIATVIAERPEAADLMRRHAEALLRSLAEAGHEEVTLQFGSEGRQGAGAREHGAGPEGREAAPILASAPGAPPARSASAGLDLRV